MTLVDTWAMFQSPSGGYADFIVDDDGEAKLMRQDDGFHLNLDGANKLARAIEAEIEKDIVARGGSALTRYCVRPRSTMAARRRAPRPCRSWRSARRGVAASTCQPSSTVVATTSA